ncbi:aminodeoxychorismate lyase [Desulfurobacterium thermolithotrophum DSM 11699]|uniref:Endolytic murein transglycosylase n=1 Tax=Desulfurobacterium thermolithotrophum (strain DSM 11699 / BSA) TaxID=868864 RepID=F0S0U2_DESTD|nr:aminodeoxychorismate lyase [Desulfurobacterium thermolithotrophum DSM 11699]
MRHGEVKKVKRFLVFVFIFILGVFFVFSYIRKSLNEKKQVDFSLKIERNQKIKKVLEKLKNLKVIENDKILYFWIRFNHIPIRAGCYRLKGEYSPIEIIQELTKGTPCLTKFTIPEGANIFDVDRILSEKGFCKKGEVIKLSKDRNFLNSLKLKFLEGYVFPDTYYVKESANCEEVLKIAVENFKKKVEPLFEGYNPPIIVKKGLGKVNKEKILTVASIVEKETSIPEEKPIIAGIIYNRLIKGMRLQCDPTVYYSYRLVGIEKRKLHKGDTLFPSPYNTYYTKGLPPTPICNPGLESIEAAMFPKKTSYLYFVAEDGRHLFSKSYNHHLKLIRKIYKYGEKRKEKTVRNR